MPGSDPTLEILIQIREELAGLSRTREALKGTKEEAGKLGQLLRQGLGIGSGMEIARRGIDLLTRSLSASVGSAFRMAEEIRDQSQALGITTKAYQVLRYELAQAGLDASRLNMAMDFQTRSLAEARAGVGAATEAYKALGLEAAQLESLAPEQRMLAVARAVLDATDQTRAFHAAAQILGTRGTPQLLAALRNLSTEGYDKVAAAAEAAGRIMGDETVTQLDKAKKAIDNFTKFTLPVAAGGVLSLADKIAQGWGALAGNITNWAAGRGTGYISGDFGQTSDAPAPAPTHMVAPATDESRFVTLMDAAAKKQELINSGLFTEAERRRALIPILREQEEWTEMLLDEKFRGRERIDPTRGDVTDAQLSEYRERNELEAKLFALRAERMRLVDTPLVALNRELLDTTGLLESSLAGALNSGIAALSANLWGAFTNTNKFSDAFRSLGNIAGQVLTELMVKLLIVRPLLSAFGVGDVGANAPIPGWTSGTPVVVKGAGGGTFMTRGPTNFTVGDNPGGMELVSVIPISGRGQTTVNGQAVHMAGGGSALVGGRRGAAGAGAPVTVNFNFSTGVAATVRAEVLAMSSQLRELAVDAVNEAHLRNRLAF